MSLYQPHPTERQYVGLVPNEGQKVSLIPPVEPEEQWKQMKTMLEDTQAEIVGHLDQQRPRQVK